jgi:putative toxin-antitoxin system antitoxin component (TIGR02293 family)
MKPQKSARRKASDTFKQVETVHRGFAEAGVIRDLGLAHMQNAPTVRATPQSLAALGQHGYSQDEIYVLVIPKRTLARRTANKEPLTVEETDKAVRLERVASLATRVFGNPDKANRWMRKPKHQLGGETPVAFLSSESGARVVEDMLYRIEHGILA